MRHLLRAFIVLLLACGTAGAEDYVFPGLQADSSAYESSLTAHSPAGLSPAARRQAEQRAADAAQRNNWSAAADALEARVGGGDTTPELWLSLGRAQLRRTPPNPARALQAGYQAFTTADDDAQVPGLLLMADAFRAMNRPSDLVHVLESVQSRAPDNADYARLLADARRAAGITVRRVRTEPEAEPPSACIEFTTAPVRRGDFVPGDWVRLQPAQPNVAVTREGDAICIAGLRLGATTTVTLRAGLPGEDGLKLNADTTLPVAMANRRPRLVFDSRMFLLPRGQTASVTLLSTNLSKVKLQLLRLSERNFAPWSRENKLGEPLESYVFNAATDNGKIVWEGTADLPHWQPNQVLRTALPLPDAFAEPGAYVLLATPGDGTPDDSAAATQVIMRTDLAPTVWRGSDGLTVQVRSFADATVRPGIKLRLLSRANDVLAEATTGDDGVARFAAPLLRGTGPQAPQTVDAVTGSEYVALDLTAAAFDLSDRGVEGAPQPGPLDGFAWTDRGIYRPGETVELMALLRDGSGTPQDVPAHVVVKRPNGQVFLDQVPPRGPDASIHLAIPLSQSAPAGQWTVELLADPKRPPIGQAGFRVDAFVPDRMAVEITPPTGALVPGKPFPVAVTARFLYGAPAANLSGKGTLTLAADPNPPAALPGYKVGLDGEIFAPAVAEFDLPTTDPQGRATLPVLLKAAPDSTHPVKADLDVGVDDPSGRASHAMASFPVRPAGNLIGIKPLFPANAIDAGGEAAFELAAVNADGARAAVPARMRLVRERPDWRVVRKDGVARYETVYRDEPIEAADIQLPAGAAFRYAKRLDFGRYRLEVTERGGLAATSVRFRAGWVASDSPDTPDKVDVSTDRRVFKAGDTARVHVVAPFAGHATVLALTDRVQGIRDVEIGAGGTDIDVPVDAAWGPGAYVTVHVFRGQGGGQGGTDRPARAIGLVWVGIDPAARTLPVAVAAPDKVAPRARVTVPVRTAPGAWITLAAVDEGVLRLTRFVSPDPVNHFLGRRTLGIDVRDDWGRLIAPGEGEATLLKQGGDGAAFALPEIPQKVVALFTPPVQAGADGVANVSPRHAGLQRPGAADGGRVAGRAGRRRQRGHGRARPADRRAAPAALPGAGRRGAAGGPGAEPRPAARRGDRVRQRGRAVAGDGQRQSVRRAGGRAAGGVDDHPSGHGGRAGHHPPGRDGARRVPGAARREHRRPVVPRTGQRRGRGRAGAAGGSHADAGAGAHGPGHGNGAGGDRRCRAVQRGRAAQGSARLPVDVPGAVVQPRAAIGAAAGRAPGGRRPRGPAAGGGGERAGQAALRRGVRPVVGVRGCRGLAVRLCHRIPPARAEGRGGGAGGSLAGRAEVHRRPGG